MYLTPTRDGRKISRKAASHADQLDETAFTLRSVPTFNLSYSDINQSKYYSIL